MTHWIVIALLAVLTVSGPQPAQAQQQSAPVIAVVDFLYVMHESAAGKAIRSQLQAQKDVFRREIAEEEKKHVAAREELARQRSLLSSEALRQRETDLKQRYAALERGAAEREHELRSMAARAEQLVDEHVKKIIDEIAGQRGIDLVLVRNHVYYLAPRYDITEETVKRLNAQLPSVDIKKLQN